MTDRIRNNVLKMRDKGASRQEVERYLQWESERRDAAPEAPQEPPATQDAWAPWRERATAFGHGATANFLDEAVGAAGAPILAAQDAWQGRPFDLSSAYARGRDAVRETLASAREKRPLETMALEAAGGISTVVASPMLRALTAAPTIARGVAAGVGMGAAYGAGAGEGVVNRLSEAGQGALIGGAAGGLAVPLVRGGASAARAIGDRVSVMRGGEQAAQSVARRKVAEALMRDNVGKAPSEAIRATRQTMDDIGPSAMLADTGENARGLLGAMHRAPGSARAMIDDAVVARQEGARSAAGQIEGGQAQRVSEMLNEIAPDDFARGQQAVRTARADRTRALYQQTANREENLVPAGAWSEDPFIAQEIRAVKRRALYGLKDAPDNSLAVIDAAQKRMSDAEQAAIRAGRRNDARLLGQKRRELVGAADEAFPDYAQARDVWRDFSGALDAGDLGRKFMRGDIDDLGGAVSRMGESERDQFRRGVVQALRQRIGEVGTHNDATKKLFGIPNLERKISMAFGDEKIFARYIKGVEGERAMFDTYAALKKGSPTAQRLAEDRDAFGVNEVAAIATSPYSPAAYIRPAIRAIQGQVAKAGTPEAARMEIARLLTAPLSRADEVAMSRVPQAANHTGLIRALTVGQAPVNQRFINQR